jgi:3'(2'), 5'-bisphosphate nucleotidase
VDEFARRRRSGWRSKPVRWQRTGEVLEAGFALEVRRVLLAHLAVRAVGVVELHEADAYVHAGGQYEWDSAAPVAVALAAGLHATRIDGSPLVYNQRDPYLPDLIVCRPELADQILKAIAAA